MGTQKSRLRVAVRHVDLDSASAWDLYRANTPDATTSENAAKAAQLAAACDRHRADAGTDFLLGWNGEAGQTKEAHSSDAAVGPGTTASMSSSLKLWRWCASHAVYSLTRVKLTVACCSRKRRQLRSSLSTATAALSSPGKNTARISTSTSQATIIQARRRRSLKSVAHTLRFLCRNSGDHQTQAIALSCMKHAARTSNACQAVGDTATTVSTTRANKVRVATTTTSKTCARQRALASARHSAACTSDAMGEPSISGGQSRGRLTPMQHWFAASPVSAGTPEHDGDVAAASCVDACDAPGVYG